MECQTSFWGERLSLAAYLFSRQAEAYSVSPPLPPIFQPNNIKETLYGKHQTVFQISTTLKIPALDELCCMWLCISPRIRLLSFTYLAGFSCIGTTAKTFFAKYLHYTQQNVHLILVNSCKYTYINWIISHFLHHHLLWQQQHNALIIIIQVIMANIRYRPQTSQMRSKQMTERSARDRQPHFHCLHILKLQQICTNIGNPDLFHHRQSTNLPSKVRSECSQAIAAQHIPFSKPSGDTSMLEV